MRQIEVNLLVAYDDVSNKAYIYLDKTAPHGDATTGGMVVDGNDELVGIVVDVSRTTGRILGFELLEPRRQLPESLLGQFV